MVSSKNKIISPLFFLHIGYLRPPFGHFQCEVRRSGMMPTSLLLSSIESKNRMIERDILLYIKKVSYYYSLENFYYLE
ncbi:MAG: hypothetical protein EU541_04770 [Promethearchaeota archaeon]|nr:MAG: hypothetical protein EU541_04770 [Candidatus Lokiarchaeota archaeon]